MDRPYEEFWIILLNRAKKVLQKVQISGDGISGTVGDPKKIFKVAPDHHASPRILGHNHPSGADNPGDADQKITRKPVNADLLFEITAFDHHFITNEGFQPLADNCALKTCIKKPAQHAR